MKAYDAPETTPAVKEIVSPAQTVSEGLEFEVNDASGKDSTTIVEETSPELTRQPLNALLCPSSTLIVMISPLAIAVPPAPKVFVLVPIIL